MDLLPRGDASQALAVGRMQRFYAKSFATPSFFIFTQRIGGLIMPEKKTSWWRSHAGVECDTCRSIIIFMQRKDPLRRLPAEILSECQGVFSERDLEEKGNCSGI